MAPARCLFAVMVAAAPTGCATYTAKTLSPAATQAQLASRTLRDDGVQRFLAAHGQPASSEAWGLAQLTLAAYYFNPELEVARAQLAEAEAGVQTAQARPNPAFTFTPGRSDATPGGISPWILSYVLNVPLEFPGKRPHRTTEAHHRAEQTRFALAARAWAIHRTVREAWLDVCGAKAVAELQRAQLPLLAEVARLIEAKVQAGDASPLQAAEAQVARERVELTVRETERAAALARSRLAEAIGVPLAALADVRLESRTLAESPVQPSVSEARTWAAQNRPDLLAALAEYAATQAALQGEVTRQYPDLQLGPGYQLDQGEGKWSLGLGVGLPVFHQNQGPIAAAEARRTAAAARFLSLQHRVLAEVDRTAADLASTQTDLPRLKLLRDALERQTRIVRAQQAAGDTSRLELTRAETAMAEHARLELDVRLRVARALGAYEDAVQRPLAWQETAWRSSRSDLR